MNFPPWWVYGYFLEPHIGQVSEESHLPDTKTTCPGQPEGTFFEPCACFFSSVVYLAPRMWLNLWEFKFCVVWIHFLDLFPSRCS